MARSKISLSLGKFSISLEVPTRIGPRWVARSKISFSLEIFNLVSISPTKIGPRWVARSKISFSLEDFSISLEISNCFSDLWALWVLGGFDAQIAGDFKSNPLAI